MSSQMTYLVGKLGHSLGQRIDDRLFSFHNNSVGFLQLIIFRLQLLNAQIGQLQRSSHSHFPTKRSHGRSLKASMKQAKKGESLPVIGCLRAAGTGRASKVGGLARKPSEKTTTLLLNFLGEQEHFSHGTFQLIFQNCSGLLLLC